MLDPSTFDKVSLEDLLDAVIDRIDKTARKWTTDKLDAIERRLQIAAAMIRGARNSLQPINRLPPELLAIIFLMRQQHLPSFLPIPCVSVYKQRHHRDWLKVLHVCRHWRAITATYARLWATIDSNLDPATFIRRSSTAPLTVYVGIRNGKINQPDLEIILRQTRRIRELHIDAFKWQTSATPLYELLKKPAKSLLSLTILIDGDRNSTPHDLPTLFSGRMPRLRQLCLEHISTWPKNHFQNLTHVCLYRQDREFRPCTNDFLDFLEGCPLLEELALIDAGPTRSTAGDVPAVLSHRVVPLDHLRELNCGSLGYALPITRLLSHLALPASAAMYFWGAPLQLPTEELSQLIPDNRSHLQNLRNIKECRLIRSLLSVGSSYQLVAVVDSVIYICGLFSPPEVVGMISHYPLNDVETLVIEERLLNSFSNITTAMWRDIFGYFPNLTYLRLRPYCLPSPTRSILSALYPAQNPVGRASDVVCPLLTSVQIEGGDDAVPAAYIALLAGARREEGSPIVDLKISSFDPRRLRPKPPPHSSRSSSPSTHSSMSSASDSDSDDLPAGEEDITILKEHVPNVQVLKKQDVVGMFPPRWPTRAHMWHLEHTNRRAMARW
ncbi:hypothetical protein ARMSODRAFT_1089683 [Armillaria solidipes]|uniref:Uncharacterized protein n=1 Tax=Armillaria solidipes TaxID=1076256 RepID=A0A2H3AVD0_9AGAR|nr:hypothetical protein ARMSODRAFT_1089683 [Armillaria solidipes]